MKARIYLLTLLTTFFIGSIVFAEAITSIPQVIKAKYTEKSRLGEMMTKQIEQFESDPKSEQAHGALITSFISRKEYKFASTLVKSLLVLNPKSHSAKFYSKQIKELQTLGGNKESKEMRRRHLEEMMEATQKDVALKYGSSSHNLLQAMSNPLKGEKNNFIKAAEKDQEIRKAALKKKYPNICKEMPDYSSKAFSNDMKLQTKLFKIRREGGTNALKTHFEEEIKKSSPSEMIIRDYTTLLLQEKKFDKAQEIFNNTRKNLMKTVENDIFTNHIEKIGDAISTEDKEFAATVLRNELMTLAIVEIDCAAQ